MELNRLVFPRPRSSYTHESMRGKILYVPKIKTAFEKIAAATKLANLTFTSSLLMDSTNVNQTTSVPNHNSVDQTSSKPSRMSDTNKLLSLDSDLVESPKMNSQYHKQKDNDLRASVPYKFTPMNGAPSVRGKNIVHFQKKIRDSCSLASDQRLSISVQGLSRGQTTQSLQVDSLRPNFETKKPLINDLTRMKSSDFIPCLLLKHDGGSSKIFLYFHANAEDLGRAYKFLTYINVYLKMHVIAVEYPGYGIYGGELPSSESIIKDADTVYNYVKDTLCWKESDIIVCGRSIGAGPACYLGSTYRPSSLVLVSPHTSIRGIVKDQFLGRFTQYVISERFNNIETIAKVVCPTFLLHGMKDTLVAHTHSQQLCDACGGPSFLLLPELMDHNNLDVIGDFIAPLSEFLDNFQIITHNTPSFIKASNQKGPCQGPHLDDAILGKPCLGQLSEEAKMIIDDASDSETGSISSDEDFIPTENLLHETEKSMNRHHPALKLNNKQNKIFEYTGPHLIIDPQYYELPELLLSKLQRSLTSQTPQLPPQNNNSMFTIHRSKDYQKNTGLHHL